MVERPAKLVPGGVDIRLDGPEREVEGGRDLLVRAAFDVGTGLFIVFNDGEEAELRYVTTSRRKPAASCSWPFACTV